MNIYALKTHKITKDDTDLFAVLDKYLPKLSENTVLAITSKIVSITEGRIVPIRKVPQVSEVPQVSQGEENEDNKELKDHLIEQESQFYLPRDENPHGVSLTITNNSLVATAGIDESNANGHYILWPKNPQESANRVRRHIREIRSVRNIGVIITDSRTAPMRWGVTAFAIAYSGFVPLKDYIGTPDIFGRPFKYEKLNIADSLASAVTVVMGEGNEQTPMSVIEDIPFVTFQDSDPTEDELASLRISPAEDLYAPLLKSVQWKKGKAK
ncbi:MAG TPA: coenzyme F420-0:L-glutamate ligase [Patescibacteria group bacterium]|nr:coenzyme F420-0:L-glutamate ligase [Patescibacteria group bacterium]